MLPLHDDNPTEITPFVTIALIGICTMVFIYQGLLPPGAGERFVFQYGAIPAIVFGQATLQSDMVPIPTYTTLLTSMFLHGGLMHLLGNMLYLWIFGNNVEDVMGHVRFIIFYIMCGVCAALSHAIIDPASTIPMVGASGAISGILGAYLLLFPRARVLILAPYVGTTYVPAGVVLGLWFVMQIFSGGASLGTTGGGVAFFAHVGGFVTGMLLIRFFKRSDVRFFAPHRDTRW